SGTLLRSVIVAQVNLLRAGSEVAIEEAVTDKGYHKAQTLAECAGGGVRTDIGEQRRRQDRVWVDKPAAWEKAYRANRRRCRGRRGKRLQKRRSEYVERTFAHVCETGGARRSWLRGLGEVCKRYVAQVAACNLGGIMRRLCGRGTPRGLQGAAAAAWAWLGALLRALAGRGAVPPTTDGGDRVTAWPAPTAYHRYATS